MVCLVLPTAYEIHARSLLVDRAQSLAQGAAVVFSDPDRDIDTSGFDDISVFLGSDSTFEVIAIVDESGTVLARWPEKASSLGATVVPTDGPRRNLTFAPGTQAISNADPPRSVHVRLSTRELVLDLENVRWLFASIFLFTSVVFFVLTTYLSRSILNPLQEIGRAARNLADGEPVVTVPVTGDREIDELGSFISKLGENRRRSRVMMSPMAVLSSQKRRENTPIPDKHADADSALDSPTVPTKSKPDESDTDS